MQQPVVTKAVLIGRGTGSGTPEALPIKIVNLLQEEDDEHDIEYRIIRKIGKAFYLKNIIDFSEDEFPGLIDLYREEDFITITLPPKASHCGRFTEHYKVKEKHLVLPSHDPDTIPM